MGARPIKNSGTNDDYSYDGNGNLKKDLNKSITAISYTYLNKPSVIRYANNNGIAYSYDAAGGKTEELVLVAGQPDKRTSYQGNFIYRNDTLQYILTAEGRTIVDPQAQEPIKEEYFVKDHLGNVRSTIDVITYWTRRYLATYEIASANLEGLIFDNLNEIRDDKPGSTDPNDKSSGRLNGAESDHRIGTSLMVKVMAGDKVDLKVNNYYDGSYNSTDDNVVVPDKMLTALTGALTGGVGGVGTSESHDVGLVDKMFNAGNYNIFQDLVNSNTDPSRPKAYLNYVFFDENMKVITQASGAFQANGNGSWAEIGTAAPLVMPANGYLAVYLSNSSNVVTCPNCGNTFFDLLKVEVSKGNLLEENHYYPHGLPIFGLSSATATDFKEQRRRYQSNEYIKDLGLNWMDFNARQYDPQIGRFLGVDPLADNGGQESLSPYAAMGNRPESFIDPNGMQQETFAQSNNSMGEESPIGSSSLEWLFRSSLSGGAFEHGGGAGFSWQGLSGAALTIHFRLASPEEKAQIMGAYYGTGYFVANISSGTGNNKSNSITTGMTADEIKKNGGIVDKSDGTSISYHWYEQSDPDDITTLQRHDAITWNASTVKDPDENSDNWWQHLIGPGMIAIGQPWVPKRFIAPGSSPGSSIISTLLSKIPLKSPVRLYAPVVNRAGARWVGTKLVGRWIARWVPFVGWAMTAYDIQTLGVHYSIEYAPENLKDGVLLGYSIGL